MNEYVKESVVTVENRPKKSWISVLSVVLALAVLTGVAAGCVNDRKKEAFEAKKAAMVLCLDTLDQAISERKTEGTQSFEALLNRSEIREVTRPQASFDKVSEVFDSTIASDSSILFLYIGMKDKRFCVRPDTSMPDDYDPTARPWYVTAISSDGITTTEFYKDDMLGDVIVSFSSAIETEGSDGPNAVMGMDFSMHLEDLIFNVAKGMEQKHWNLMLIANSGGLVHETSFGEVVQDARYSSQWDDLMRSSFNGAPAPAYRYIENDDYLTAIKRTEYGYLVINLMNETSD